jgi:hypothetical protein
VFENDEDLKDFLENENEYEDNDIASILKNCVQSESLFTRDDHTKNIMEEVSVRKVQETRKVNIGTDSSPKYITWELIAQMKKLINISPF